MKYLEYFPGPVLDDLVNGRWLPIVGAGMSLNAQIPGTRRPPLWNELGSKLEEELRDFSAGGTIDAISAYEHEFGRPRLVERLAELLLLREARPGRAHKEFCSIPFDIVCTTNFDFLLERQYALLSHYVHPVVNEDQLTLNIATPGTLLLKLHGDIHHPDRLIVSESDYDGFLTQYPLLATYLSNQLITKTAVLIGYSLDDPDFRQIWHIVSHRLGRARRKAYALVVGAKSSDISRFERRGVTAINLPGSRDTYGEVLATTFVELKDHLRKRVFSVSTIKEERPLEELLLPRSTKSKLCFFAIPLESLAFYRDRIFPAVEDAGLVPVTADDVVSPGDSVNAKIDALIDRAGAVVVELGSAWTEAELKTAIARAKEKKIAVGAKIPESPQAEFRLVIVLLEGQLLPSWAAGYDFLVRAPVWENDEGFLAGLKNLLRGPIMDEAQPRIGEASRLLKAKEYRAAVIAAMTALEDALRARLNKVTWTVARRPMSMRSLIEQAISEQLVPIETGEEVLSWTKTRNLAVHTSESVSPSIAKAIVEGVDKLLPMLS